MARKNTQETSPEDGINEPQPEVAEAADAAAAEKGAGTPQEQLDVLAEASAGSLPREDEPVVGAGAEDVSTEEDAGLAQAQARSDEETDAGYRGQKVDPLPNAHYALPEPGDSSQGNG